MVAQPVGGVVVVVVAVVVTKVVRLIVVVSCEVDDIVVDEDIDTTGGARALLVYDHLKLSEPSTVITLLHYEGKVTGRLIKDNIYRPFNQTETP